MGHCQGNGTFIFSILEDLTDKNGCTIFLKRINLGAGISVNSLLE